MSYLVVVCDESSTLPKDDTSTITSSVQKTTILARKRQLFAVPNERQCALSCQEILKPNQTHLT
jgi:hypothetical protein